MVDDPQQVIDAAAIVAEIAYSEFTHAEKSYHFKRQGLPPQHVRGRANRKKCTSAPGEPPTPQIHPLFSATASAQHRQVPARPLDP